MGTTSLSESYFDLWLLIGKVNHLIMLIRQRELNQYHIPVQQTHVLRTIKALGENATLAELAKEVEREIHVISRQAVSMEKEGLIKRVKKSPKSKLLILELTEKGLEMARVSRQSEAIDAIFSSLSAEQRQQLESILNAISVKVAEYDK
jgi:DNA-binding MarR family transcriptional regulator